MGPFTTHGNVYRTAALTTFVAFAATTLVLATMSVRAPSEPPPARDPIVPMRLPVFEGSALQWRILSGQWAGKLTPMAAPAERLTIARRMLEQYRPAGHRVYRDRPMGYAPRAIVLHGTGSGQPGSEFASLGKLYMFFARPAAEASAHYAIDRDGRIMQMVPVERAAFHVATDGWNDISIGIELLNDNSGTQPFPQAQLDAATQLARALGRQHGIPVEGVVRHRTVQPIDRRDPAGNFPWREWLRSLAARGSS